MRYPIITLSDCQRLATEMNKGTFPSLERYTQERYTHRLSTGDVMDQSEIKRAAVLIHDILEKNRAKYGRDRDRLEGRVAPILYSALHKVDLAVLDDPGFWCFLSLKYFWNFIAWREKKAFTEGNYLKYVCGERSTESVLTRMYLRVQALGGSEYGSMASEVPMATDFWRSHIIRVRTGTAPSLTRAFVERQRDDRLNTPELRQFARRLNRTWTNILLNIYDDEEARQLIEELWTR